VEEDWNRLKKAVSNAAVEDLGFQRKRKYRRLKILNQVFKFTVQKKRNYRWLLTKNVKAMRSRVWSWRKGDVN
jgi:hypothetical protein